ncbi:hypothetical protein KR009_005265 [Drosophila setifemur]|nr:hypothetical protein KR009_005265 [Drosophila setifemur]
MCPNENAKQNLLPDCRIANRVFLFTVLQTLQSQERRPEDVEEHLRDRYDVFRQVLPNYPLPELDQPWIGPYSEERSASMESVSMLSSGETGESDLESDSSPMPLEANEMAGEVN